MATSKGKKLQTQEEREEAIKKALAAIEKETSELKDEVEDIDEDLAEKKAADAPDMDGKEEEIGKKVADEEKEESEDDKDEEIEEDKDLVEESDEEDAPEKDTKEEKKVKIEEKEEKTEEYRSEKVEADEGKKQPESREETREEEKEESSEKTEKTASFGPLEEDKNQNSLLWKFVYIVAFFVGVGGAVLIYQVTSNNTPKTEIVEEVTPTVTEAPVEEEIDFSEYPITVQNGAGVAGVAAAGRDLLEDAGFTVADTGNADNYDYEETVIIAGEDVPEEVIEALREALEAEYIVADEIEELDEASEILVIIGSSASE